MTEKNSGLQCIELSQGGKSLSQFLDASILIVGTKFGVNCLSSTESSAYCGAQL